MIERVELQSEFRLNHLNICKTFFILSEFKMRLS